MKKIIVFAVIALLAACNPKSENKSLSELTAKRDSLQMVQADIEIQLNKIGLQIAELDSSINPNDLKLIKKITMQKNRIVGMEQKITALENQMTARNQKLLIPVEVKDIQPELFNHYIVTYGDVEAKNYALISPEMGGRIEKIYVSNGDYVNKGHLLVSLNTAAIDKQIEGLKGSLELATKTFSKLDTLYKQNIGSEIEYLTAKNTKDNLESQMESLQAQKRMAQIRAPFDGIVDKIFSKEGEIAGPSFPVIEFVNLKKLVIKAKVSESHINNVFKGETVEIRFNSLPGHIVKAQISQVSKVINTKSRTFGIEMEIDNPGDKIKPNMVSAIMISDLVVKDAFVVPSLAIRKDITGNFVYVVNNVNGANMVGKKYITTGLSYDDKTLVTNGLGARDRVIIKGFHLVSAGVEVNLIN
jgi:RND family efflux transporter MFP subunit